MEVSPDMSLKALKELHEVQLSLFVRNKNRLKSGSKERSDIIDGDAMNYNSVKNALAGHDIVYVNLFGSE